MLHDQVTTILAAIAVPLLLLNSVGIVRGAYATSLSIAGGTAHRGRRTCGRVAAKPAMIDKR
jgi:hypothetical protein